MPNRNSLLPHSEPMPQNPPKTTFIQHLVPATSISEPLKPWCVARPRGEKHARPKQNAPHWCGAASGSNFAVLVGRLRYSGVPVPSIKQTSKNIKTH